MRDILLRINKKYDSWDSPLKVFFVFGILFLLLYLYFEVALLIILVLCLIRGYCTICTIISKENKINDERQNNAERYSREDYI